MHQNTKISDTVTLYYNEPMEGWGVTPRSGKMVEVTNQYTLPEQCQTQTEREQWMKYYCNKHGITKYESNSQV